MPYLTWGEINEVSRVDSTPRPAARRNSQRPARVQGRGRRAGPPAGGLGANFLDAIFGLRDKLSEYTGRGMSYPQIFAAFSQDLAENRSDIERIPAGGDQEAMRKEGNRLDGLRQGLLPVFAQGASMGERDKKDLNAFVDGVQAHTRTVRAAKTKYGLRAGIDSTVSVSTGTPTKPVARQPVKAGMKLPFSPWWLLLLLPLARFAKR